MISNKPTFLIDLIKTSQKILNERYLQSILTKHRERVVMSPIILSH